MVIVKMELKRTKEDDKQNRRTNKTKNLQKVMRFSAFRRSDIKKPTKSNEIPEIPEVEIEKTYKK